MKYKTCEEIYTAFVNQGWSKDIRFEKVNENGKTLFKMVEPGNLYDDHGRIYCFNIPTAK